MTIISLHRTLRKGTLNYFFTTPQIKNYENN
jgi:hypothetical protein